MVNQRAGTNIPVGKKPATKPSQSKKPASGFHPGMSGVSGIGSNIPAQRSMLGKRVKMPVQGLHAVNSDRRPTSNGNRSILYDFTNSRFGSRS